MTALMAGVLAAKDQSSAPIADRSHDCRIRANQPAPAVGDEPPHRRRFLAGQERLRDFDGRLEALLTGDELDNAVSLVDGGSWTPTSRHREARFLGVPAKADSPESPRSLIRRGCLHEARFVG